MCFISIASYLCLLEIIHNKNDRNNIWQRVKKILNYLSLRSFAVLWFMHKSKFPQNGKIPLPMEVIL